MKPPRKPKDTHKPDADPSWQRVKKTVTPLRSKSAKPLPSKESFSNMLRLPPVPPAPLPPVLPELEINQDKKTRRGRVEIDAKIDLHDLTQAEAFPALERAIIRAANRNKKCVLVITGKGVRYGGVLRRRFPDWINAPELRPLIATYAPAHMQHGGAGAWYVFLKR